MNGFYAPFINSSIIVDAFNVSGARIVTSIKITLTSPNVKFSDNSLTKTVTTSAAGSVNESIVITGPGALLASANVAI
jgi:hypothetical protein